ncbi:MFS general substrate transporter [Tilletiaria anomala UBC 951]|uniref:MFS general substrate transporter n=1 Tax=Tilletiaria anomala (strain ATCC 24038 / CBS 436.72 / UBC 951) TaxID=1037660 RepID=A0A066VKG3_TILAU|nr:MFS general substrate transporter [Tilletiaria anomala UBC 951]KDN41956.1 MFS general substrate transporter [Tilletiaria anomala UBC 951]
MASPPTRSPAELLPQPFEKHLEEGPALGSGSVSAEKVHAVPNASLTAEDDGPSTIEDAAETRRIMRKLDWRILPVCSLLYLFSFLDRSSIGNAKVAGMNKTLHLTSSEYNLAVSIFFVLYCFLEVPSNIALKRLGAKTWLPIIVFGWGVVMTLHGIVQSATGLTVARLFLGAAEAGLFPGVSLLLSYLYPRSHIQLRLGIFFANATIAGAFGGLLAYGLSFVRSSNLEGWRFIFIVEGIATCVAAGIGWFLLFNGYDDAHFLTASEKAYMGDRINYDGTEVAMNQSFQWKFVLQGLKDVKTWLSLITYIGVYAPVYSIALTLPSILSTSLGYSSVRSQLLTVPVYGCAAVVVVMWSFAADRLRSRTFFLLMGTMLSAIGWGIGLASSNPRVGFAGVFLSAAGSYGAFPSVVALVSQNVGGQTKRGVALGILGTYSRAMAGLTKQSLGLTGAAYLMETLRSLVGVGGLCGVIAPNIFLASESPRYPTAYKINIGLNALGFLGALLNAAYLIWANKRKQRAIDSGAAARLGRQELADLGDESPYFRYRL